LVLRAIKTVCCCWLLLLLQCAGFLPRDPEYASLLENAKVDVPTLFVMGQSDALIPPARSHALMDTFDQRTADMFEHPGVAG
jgi:predicted esterase